MQAGGISQQPVNCQAPTQERRKSGTTAGITTSDSCEHRAGALGKCRTRPALQCSGSICYALTAWQTLSPTHVTHFPKFSFWTFRDLALANFDCRWLSQLWRVTTLGIDQHSCSAGFRALKPNQHRRAPRCSECCVKATVVAIYEPLHAPWQPRMLRQASRKASLLFGQRSEIDARGCSKLGEKRGK